MLHRGDGGFLLGFSIRHKGRQATSPQPRADPTRDSPIHPPMDSPTGLKPIPLAPTPRPPRLHHHRTHLGQRSVRGVAGGPDTADKSIPLIVGFVTAFGSHSPRASWEQMGFVEIGRVSQVVGWGVGWCGGVWGVGVCGAEWGGVWVGVGWGGVGWGGVGAVWGGVWGSAVVWRSVVQCGAVWCSVVQCGGGCGVIWGGVVWRDMAC